MDSAGPAGFRKHPGLYQQRLRYYAARFIEKIIEAVEGLENFPKIGRSVPEAEEENIRGILLHNYRIIYRVETDRILVLTIIHGARDLSRRRTKPWDII